MLSRNKESLKNKLFNIDLILFFIALASVSYSAFIAFTYANQAPLDWYAFRQTQTALTAYWFMQEGFKLAYETPVGGRPWSIPFEFPIYQMLVAFISKLFQFSLDATGRVISYFFLFLTIFPAYSIVNRLKLSSSILLTFVSILFSMPIYLYWGRSFMIETAALFFSIMGIKYFLDYLLLESTKRSVIFFILFVTLAVLQKATTVLPVLLVLAIVYMFYEFKKLGSIRLLLTSKKPYIVGFYFLIPILIGYSWVVYSDHIKELNLLDQHLTSEKLSQWNWGTISQKLSSEIWINVLWGRIFVPNMASFLGVFIIALPFLMNVKSNLKNIVFCSLLLAIIPLFIFTNLHLVHSYYQSANVIFIAFALAVSIGLLTIQLGKYFNIFLVLLVMTSNYLEFNENYLPSIKQTFDKSGRDFAIGEIIKREVPNGKQVVIYGNDWSSTIAYIAQRKSFTVPNWNGVYDQVFNAPESFFDKDQLAAIVNCNSDVQYDHWLNWASSDKSWKLAESNACLILTPSKRLPESTFHPVDCEGSIDVASVEKRQGIDLIIFSGWSRMSGNEIVIPDDVFLMLSSEGKKPILFDTLKVPRFDVNQYLKIPTSLDVGFSRLLSADLEPGEYSVSLIQGVNGLYQSCKTNKLLRIDI